MKKNTAGSQSLGALLRPFLLILITGLVFGQTVLADTLYSTRFEQPTFQNGDLVSGLDKWLAPPPLSPNAALVTNTFAKSGSQSVVVSGSLLDPSGGPFGSYAAIGSYRRQLGISGFTMTPKKSLARVDADLLLETKQTKTSGEFFSLTIAARSGDGETLGEIGLSSQGMVEAFGFNAPGGGEPSFVKTIRFNKWYHITMLFDYTNRTTSYFLDDHFLGAVPAPSASTVLLRGAMVVYARPDGDVSGGESNTRNNYTARFDNFRISVHNAMTAPEIK